jgi:uncharacterized membrane protein
MSQVNRRLFAASVLTAALGIAAAASPGFAQQGMSQDQMMKMKQSNMDRAKKGHLVACYGINAAGRNDCAVGAHSCAGQATQARDPNSFVLVPAGDCEKIDGGKLKAG